VSRHHKSSGKLRPTADLLERVAETIRSRRLFRAGEAILIAVSGGLDSLVLLHLLHHLAPAHKWRLSVAHLNHRLRGRSSDADERLVQSVCKKLALPVFVECADVRELAGDQKLSIEMAARKARHEFLARVAAREKISTIAFAHHADDQVELFFIRLLRGSGGEGLAGMKWRNPSPFAKGVQIVRPLLGETKSALRDFAAKHQIKFREDATNDSVDILRNRIRHELLPLLKNKYQPTLNRIVLRLMDILGGEADLAKSVAEDWLEQSQKATSASRTRSFSELPLAVQRRCIQSQLLAEKIAPDFELIEKLRLMPGKCVTVTQSDTAPFGVFRETAGFIRRRSPEAVKFNNASHNLSLGEPAGQATFDGIAIIWQTKAEPRKNLPKQASGTEYFDAESVGSRAVLRHWRKGDRFQPIGMPSAVKLQDIFVNQRVPRALRHQLVVAESEKGEIFWVEGLRISERFKLTKATKRRLQWQWRRD
jgi:tRNA(Ile)-lysidine synthase